MFRRLFGIVLVVAAIFGGVVLQLGWGAVFSTRVVHKGPELPITSGSMKFQALGTSEYHVEPNWPVSVLLVSAVVGGAVLAALPQHKRSRTRG